MSTPINYAGNTTSYLWSLVIVNVWGNYCLQGDAIADIQSPAETPIVQDAIRWYEPGGAANMYRSTWQIQYYASPHGTGGNEVTNVAYLDGHVKALPILKWGQELRASQSTWP